MLHPLVLQYCNGSTHYRWIHVAGVSQCRIGHSGPMAAGSKVRRNSKDSMTMKYRYSLIVLLLLPFVVARGAHGNSTSYCDESDPACIIGQNQFVFVGQSVRSGRYRRGLFGHGTIVFSSEYFEYQRESSAEHYCWRAGHVSVVVPAGRLHIYFYGEPIEG